MKASPPEAVESNTFFRRALEAARSIAQSADRLLDLVEEATRKLDAAESPGPLTSVLADAGAKIDTRDPAFQQTALMMAVRENRTEVVRFLVERHADVNARKNRHRTTESSLCGRRSQAIQRISARTGM